jgi:hypothetical protein
MANAFVYVIESPSDTDLLDGRMEGRSLCESLQLAGIPHAYSLVTSQRTLSEALSTRIAEAMKKFPGRYPILHLSLHGNSNGVALTNGHLRISANVTGHFGRT